MLTAEAPSRAGQNAKTIAALVSRMHNEMGASGVTGSGVNAYWLAAKDDLSVLNLTPDRHLEGVSGPLVSVKDVRGFLWKHRKQRRTQRPNMVVWTAYDETNDRSFIGLGALVRQEVAEKYNSRYPES